MELRSGPLGDLFRRARTERGDSLGAAAEALHVPARYVHALESEDYAALPPAVYTRALIRAYARYLGMRPAEILERSVPMRSQDRNPIRPAIQPLERPLPISWKALAFTAGITGFVGLFLYLHAQYSSFAESVELGQRASVELPTPSGRIAAALLTPFPTGTLAPALTPQATATVIPGLFVEMRVVERSWVQVWADGRSVLAEPVNVGSQRAFSADQSVRMRVGNAGGIDVTVNGTPQGRLGSAGQALDVTWSRE